MIPHTYTGTDEQADPSHTEVSGAAMDYVIGDYHWVDYGQGREVAVNASNKQGKRVWRNTKGEERCIAERVYGKCA